MPIRTMLAWRSLPALVLVAWATVAWAEDPYVGVWAKALATTANDFGRGVAVDALGNVFLGGITNGELAGSNAGGTDVFVARYDTSSNLIWSRQFGTSANDGDNGALVPRVAADGLGNVLVTGTTAGGLGGTNAGGFDAFVVKYDQMGNQVWVRQLGADGYDTGAAVAADSLGNVLLSGHVSGDVFGPSVGMFSVAPFLAKYDAAGNLLWGRKLSAPGASYGVAADSAGSIYFSGDVSGRVFGHDTNDYDAFLAKYDGSGNLLWGRTFGSNSAEIQCRLALDVQGNAYVFGKTSGDFGGQALGGPDLFLAKYDAAGKSLWTRHLGTSSWEEGISVTVDAQGGVYIGGTSEGSLFGPHQGAAGAANTIIAKYDSAGSFLWGMQLGAANPPRPSNSYLAADAVGNLYAGGAIVPAMGVIDARLVKYSRPGDLNYDGIVNLLDIQIVGLNWQTAGPTGDANGDGVVNLLDVQVVGLHWSTPIPGVTAVPEPAAWLLGLSIVPWVLLHSRKRGGQASVEDDATQTIDSNP